jgi:penicillin-binding protein 2
VPSIVEGTVQNGSLKHYDNGNQTRVMKSTTAKILRNYLQSVLEEGTGESAKPKTVSAAGKTATAQTGKYENGVEICQGWFCGFFPAENPRYTVTVFSENTKKQTKSCSEIFAIIADEVTNYKNLQ